MRLPDCVNVIQVQYILCTTDHTMGTKYASGYVRLGQLEFKNKNKTSVKKYYHLLLVYVTGV